MFQQTPMVDFLGSSLFKANRTCPVSKGIQSQPQINTHVGDELGSQPWKITKVQSLSRY